jgi:hypothetical protein
MGHKKRQRTALWHIRQLEREKAALNASFKKILQTQNIKTEYEKKKQCHSQDKEKKTTKESI